MRQRAVLGAGALTHISISAGSLDRPTGLKVKEHIFLAQKGDYYQLPCAAV
jgi:hypothetical protein